MVKGRNARELTRQLAAQKAGTTPAAAKTASPPVIRNRAFRFRNHLVPLGWIAAATAGLAAHHAGAWALALVTYVAASLAAGLFVRHRPPFPRQATASFAAWMTVTGTLTAVAGLVRPLDIALVLVWGWMAGRWLHHYGWRPMHPAVVTFDTSVHAIFARLAEKNKWSAHLGSGRPIENGMQYPVICDGAHTHIDQIMDKPAAVAAAYDAPTTEAYVEPEQSGIKSRGLFTRLDRGTLDDVRIWDGATVDRDTGLAVVGRFPDGKPVRERYLIRPRDGVKHTLITGCDGSGKTGLIDLGLSISATSGFIAPVILDPQMGQALPAWRDHVPYACGPEQCMAFLRGLHGAMMDRSDYLGQLEWVDARGKTRRGMGWFDPFLTGLPIIEITIDEAPVLLAMKGAVPLVLDLGKLGRKAGFRLRLAAQVPSMKEMGATELRSILVGGNVFCLRAGDKVSGGMVNIPAPPWELPKVFRNGLPTYGLGYAATVDSRPASPMRTDLVPDAYEVAETTRIRGMDDRAAAKMAEIIAQDEATAAELQQLANDSARIALAVLAKLRAEPMAMGELLVACQDLNLGISQVTDALAKLQGDGDVRLDGTVYRVVTK